MGGVGVLSDLQKGKVGPALAPCVGYTKNIVKQPAEYDISARLEATRGSFAKCTFVLARTIMSYFPSGSIYSHLKVSGAGSEWQKKLKNMVFSRVVLLCAHATRGARSFSVQLRAPQLQHT